MRGAHVVGVHWRGETNYPLTGERSHEIIAQTPGLVTVVHHGTGVCAGYLGKAVNQRNARRAVVAVGVVLPVHDEEKMLPRSLRGLEAAVDALPPPISCRVAVVLDHCGDASAAIAHTWGARFGALVLSQEWGAGHGSPSGQPGPSVTLAPRRIPRESGSRQMWFPCAAGFASCEA